MRSVRFIHCIASRPSDHHFSAVLLVREIDSLLMMSSALDAANVLAEQCASL